MENPIRMDDLGVPFSGESFLVTFPGRTANDPSMKHYGIGDFIHTASNVVGDLQGHLMRLMGKMGNPHGSQEIRNNWVDKGTQGVRIAYIIAIL